MIRIVVLFNLKPGVDAGVYDEWAQRVDLPVVNQLTSIERFEIFKSTSLLGSSMPPPYQYIEIVEVRDMDAFGRDIASQQMQRVAAEFAVFADATFIVTRPLGESAQS